MPTRYKKPLNKADTAKSGSAICQNENCSSKGKELSPDEFFKSRNSTIGRHPYCKECVEKMVDLNNLDTVFEILRVLDTPFIMDEWNKICKEYDSNYIGHYLYSLNFTNKSKYFNLRFIDSIYQLSEDEEVSEKIEDVVNDVPTWNDEWQGTYTASDLKYLNEYYQGLNNDFKIITTNHKDYARKIAQASLSQMKAYQKLLAGVDGADIAYEKATKMFDMLSKSAQFAESQRGANDVALGCFGRVFDAVEKHNWVPDYIPTDEDMYDKLLKQFSNIERSL